MIGKSGRQQRRRARLLANANVERAHAAHQQPGVEWAEDSTRFRSRVMSVAAHPGVANTNLFRADHFPASRMVQSALAQLSLFAASNGTISKTRGERLRHSGLTSEALFDELWQKRDVIAA